MRMMKELERYFALASPYLVIIFWGLRARAPTSYRNQKHLHKILKSRDGEQTLPEAAKLRLKFTYVA